MFTEVFCFKFDENHYIMAPHLSSSGETSQLLLSARAVSLRAPRHPTCCELLRTAPMATRAKSSGLILSTLLHHGCFQQLTSSAASTCTSSLGLCSSSSDGDKAAPKDHGTDPSKTRAMWLQATACQDHAAA